ncbi:hypothetical protein [Nannocystis bainbridge]|uniref:Uncharacterized protein n=1 Tax=Nannocystis bainbridge TaxID=2995303 RepID=A0ABT5E791_9BACT|nr:hypothetical protein [Nannocystis bainbridge]MDC0721733.1 hypothetical protein [Nannocystis bainbridge]
MDKQHRTPICSTDLSAFSCPQPELLVGVLSKHPTLAPLLLQIAEQVPRFFRRDAVKQLRLRPSSGTYTAVDDGVVVEIVVAADDPDADESLDRFDEEWWFDASGRCTAETVVDIRRE